MEAICSPFLMPGQSEVLAVEFARMLWGQVVAVSFAPLTKLCSNDCISLRGSSLGCHASLNAYNLVTNVLILNQKIEISKATLGSNNLDSYGGISFPVRSKTLSMLRRWRWCKNTSPRGRLRTCGRHLLEFAKSKICHLRRHLRSYGVLWLNMFRHL